VKGSALRRLLHAGSAAVLLIPVLADWDRLRSVLVVVAVVAVVGDVARIKLPQLSHRLATWVPVFRPGETERLCGATWLSLGYALAAWFPPISPAAGILVSALADPAASWVGGWKSRSVGKTANGSMAALVTSLVVLAMLGLPWEAVVAGAVVGTLLERWPGSCNDNLVVAPGVACVVWLLS